MDEFFRNPEIPWQGKAAAGLFIGLVPVLFFLLFRRSWLVRLSRIPGFGPNGLTLWGFAIYLVGEALLYRGRLTVGWILVVIGGIFDVLDGRMAKIMEQEGIFRSAADKRIGKWLDPLIDKLKYLPPLAYFIRASFICSLIGWPIILGDLLGTLIRPPFAFWRKMNDAETASNAAGKFKALFQVFGLITCAPLALAWYTNDVVPNLFFGAALALFCLSLALRLRAAPERLRLLMERLKEKLFSHQDIS